MDLRAQTFGVEIEMTGITRNRAAKTIAAYFGKESTHYGGTYDTYQAGDSKGRTWKAMSDSSIKAEKKNGGRASDLYKTEVVTPILRYEDIEDLQEVLRRLRKAGAIVNESTGIHIHIGAENFTPATLCNLLKNIRSKEDILYKAIQVKNSRVYYCKKTNQALIEMIEKHRPTTREKLADLWYQEAPYGRERHYNESRYHGLYAEYKNYAEILLGKSVISVLSPKISQHNSLQSFEKCLQIRIIIPIRHVGSMHLPVHRLQRFAASFRISLRIYLCGFNGFMSKEVADVD